MKAPFPIFDSNGFTLIEVLTALGLCAFLAVATATAITFAARSDLRAQRQGEASLLLPSCYAAQRLRPDDLPNLPSGWSLDRSTDILPLPNDELCEWHLLVLRDHRSGLPPLTLRILNEVP